MGSTDREDRLRAVATQAVTIGNKEDEVVIKQSGLSPHYMRPVWPTAGLESLRLFRWAQHLGLIEEFDRGWLSGYISNKQGGSREKLCQPEKAEASITLDCNGTVCMKSIVKALSTEIGLRFGTNA